MIHQKIRIVTAACFLLIFRASIGIAENIQNTAIALEHNRIPILQSIGNHRVKCGQLLAFTVIAADEDISDKLTYSATPLPIGAFFDSDLGTFIWTPTTDDQGDHHITISVSDNGSPQGTDKEIITISVEEDFGSKFITEIGEGFDYDIRFLSYGIFSKYADSYQNPDNTFLKIPDNAFVLDFRPDLFLNYGPLNFSAKPRLSYNWEDYNDTWDDDSLMIEWLARWKILENLFISYGRENLQWGPSYLRSTSNPFFDENGRENPKQEIAGMDFLRLVYVANLEWTISLIANTALGEQELINSDFEKTYALKIDHNGTENYIGLILSYKEEDRVRLGLFGGLTASDALLLYAEGVVSEGNDALYPEESTSSLFGFAMERSLDDDSNLNGILTVGGSYTLLSGATLTAEYTRNQYGYDDQQANDYFKLRDIAGYNLSISPVYASQTLLNTYDPGLKLLRQNYCLFQYVRRNIRDILDLTFRYVHNLDDRSNNFIGIGEYYIGDHTQLFIVGSLNSGSDHTEYGSIYDYQVYIGIEYTL